MNVLKMGDELLRQKCEPVHPVNDSWARLTSDMIDTMHAGKGVGLAGPQVGVLKRLFVCHVEGDKPRVFINPTIIETSTETTKYEEGCMSIPSIYADVIRPVRVRVQAWNERGRPFTLNADGMLARVIQHECDHLEGVLFLDKISEMKRKRLLAKYEKRLKHKR